MPVPKSVVKFKKDGDGVFIEFVSNVDTVNYTMRELSRAALRDVGRFLRKRYKDRYYSVYKKISGNGKFAISYKVNSSSPPHMDIGIKHSAPGKPVRGFYTFFHEVGTIRYAARPLLKRIVEDNIADVQRIEEAYLGALNDETDAMRLIGKNDEDDDD